MIEFESWWQTNGIQALRKTIKQRVIHFGYPKRHRVRDISDSIRRMGSGDNYTTEISNQLHLTKGNKPYRSSNKVNYIGQMLKHNDRSTSLD
jgi:hypothetical protein